MVRSGISAAALAVGVLACAACVRTQASTYRWGGRGAPGAYLLDMGSMRRAGPHVDFVTVFVPAADPKTPDLSKMYVRAEHWVDCVRGLKFETGQQVYISGVQAPVSDTPDKQPTPIAPDSVWSSVRDLVCTGRNDQHGDVLSGTDDDVAKQARGYMAGHPLET